MNCRRYPLFLSALCLILMSCHKEPDYAKDIAIVSGVCHLHKNISIGKRGDEKMVALKGHTISYMTLAVDELTNRVTLKEKPDSVFLKLMSVVLKADTNHTIDDEKLVGLFESRLTKIMSECRKATIIASDGFEDEDIADYVFYYTNSKRIILLKDKKSIYLQKGEILYSSGNWVVVSG